MSAVRIRHRLPNPSMRAHALAIDLRLRLDAPGGRCNGKQHPRGDRCCAAGSFWPIYFGARRSVTLACKVCGASIPQESRVCLSCQADAGFPNVRRAEKDEEVAALKLRISEADVSAQARGATSVL